MESLWKTQEENWKTKEDLGMMGVDWCDAGETSSDRAMKTTRRPMFRLEKEELL